MDKAYSIDEETFNFDCPGDALDALECEGRLEVGAVYYETDTEEVDFSDYFNADRLIDYAQDALWDDLGEASDGLLYFSKESVDELATLLGGWVAKHTTGVRAWRCVGKTREIKVTEEDIRGSSE